MIAEPLQLRATKNLLATYFELGLAAGSGEAWHDSGFRACLGDLDHPICNFAADLRLDPWSVRRLRALAASRGSFNVYVVPSDQPEHLVELLERAGFRKQFELVQMVAKPAAYRPIGVKATLELAEITDLKERFRLARFMSDQFFSRQTDLFRKRVATVTAQAKNLKLYSLGDAQSPKGGVMLSSAEGVLGIYNLCVSSAHRGNGIGAELVNWAMDQADGSDILPTLQCDQGLVPWYYHLGFQSVGLISVYTLCDDESDVILEAV